MKRIFITLICLGISLWFGARVMALSITTTSDPNLLTNTILGPGITIMGTPIFTGASNASGIFSGGILSGIGIEAGIILTSGTANDAIGPNSNYSDMSGSFDDTTTNNGLAGDADLDTLASGDTYDSTSLEFSFETVGGDLFFNYVFASEEYDDFVDAGFDDVFGFFLDGTNVALIPGSSDPVSIDNINTSSHSTLYNRNTSGGTGPYDIEYDGFTTVFGVEIFGLSPGYHTIKLAIADVGDGILDSAVFIEAGSFFANPRGNSVPIPSTILIIGFGTTGVLVTRSKKKKDK